MARLHETEAEYSRTKEVADRLDEQNGVPTNFMERKSSRK